MSQCTKMLDISRLPAGHETSRIDNNRSFHNIQQQLPESLTDMTTAREKAIGQSLRRVVALDAGGTGGYASDRRVAPNTGAKS